MCRTTLEIRSGFIDSIVETALSGQGISREQALEIGDLSRPEMEYLFEGTNKIRARFKGQDVKICSIVNAKSGKCPENCGFCAQSSEFKTDTPEYSLLNVEQIVRAAKEAEAFGANEFSVVTAGTALNDRKELDVVIEAIKRIKTETRLEVCCSLGLMNV